MINPKKTILFAKAVDYLGYRVTGDGLTLTDKFITDIREWAQPSGPKELATALGFFGYYREFLPQFSRLTADMNGMKAKRKWEVGDWDSKLANQFQELKDLFCLEGGPCRAIKFPLMILSKNVM